MRTTLVPLLLLAPLSMAQERAEPDPLRVALDAWLDLRFQDALEPPPVLLEASLAELEAALRAGRVGVGAPPVEPGELTSVPLVCDHVDYETEAFLYVSKRYEPGTPTSLLIIGHGGNSAMSRDYAARASRGGLQPWIGEVERRGWVLAAPLTRRGWGGIGNSVLLSLVSKLSRELSLDPDRVYVTGHSMGGHLSWRSGIFLGDRWAAVAPMSGGYDYVENRQVEQLFNVPGYATWGVREPYDIAKFNRRIRDWMAERDYPWVNVEKPGGHQIFADEIPKAAAFLAAHSRDPYARRVFAWGRGRLRWDAAPKRDDWDAEHGWDPERPILRETMHWVRLTPRATPEGGEPFDQRVWAVNAGDNLIELTTSEVRRLRLYLHPRMIDFARPLRVEVNGDTVFEGRVEPDTRTLLEHVRERDDRGRVYHAALDLEIETDAEVPVPRY